MRYTARVLVDCNDLGRRVTVRVKLSTGGFGDVVGVLETCNDDSYGIRDRTGKLRSIARSEVFAAKVVPPPPRQPGR